MIAELEALIAEHPTHERFHAQRVLALYRAGRQSDATEAYREASRTLVAEIGAGPGPELRELQEAILRQDPALDARPLQQELPRQLEGGLSAPRRAGARAALAAQALGGGRERARPSCAGRRPRRHRQDPARGRGRGGGTAHRGGGPVRGGHRLPRGGPGGDPCREEERAPDPGGAGRCRRRLPLDPRGRFGPRGRVARFGPAPVGAAPGRAWPAGIRRGEPAARVALPADRRRGRDRRALRPRGGSCDAARDADGRERGGAAADPSRGERLGAGAGGAAAGGNSGPGRRRSRRAARGPGEVAGSVADLAARPRANGALPRSRSHPIRRHPRSAPSAASRRSTPPTPSTSSAASGWWRTWWRDWSAPP